MQLTGVGLLGHIAGQIRAENGFGNMGEGTERMISLFPLVHSTS